MSRTAEITTPFPTPREVASRLGMSQQRQDAILEIIGLHKPKKVQTRTAYRDGRTGAFISKRSDSQVSKKGQRAKAKG